MRGCPENFPPSKRLSGEIDSLAVVRKPDRGEGVLSDRLSPSGGKCVWVDGTGALQAANLDTFLQLCPLHIGHKTPAVTQAFPMSCFTGVGEGASGHDGELSELLADEILAWARHRGEGDIGPWILV